jgi:hypothetical protein
MGDLNEVLLSRAAVVKFDFMLYGLEPPRMRNGRRGMHVAAAALIFVGASSAGVMGALAATVRTGVLMQNTLPAPCPRRTGTGPRPSDRKKRRETRTDVGI